MTSIALAPADLVWSAAFHSFGTWTFLVAAGVILLEAPLVKWLLRTPWDDAFGAVFLGHVAPVPLALLLGWGFTSALGEFSVGRIGGWGEAWAVVPRFVGALWAGAGEVLGWPAAGGTLLWAAFGLSVLTFLVTARAVLRVPWNLRSVSVILLVALVSAGAVAGAILLRNGGEEEAAAGAV